MVWVIIIHLKILWRKLPWINGGDNNGVFHHYLWGDNFGVKHNELFIDINEGDKNRVFLHDLMKITEGTVSEGTIFMHINYATLYLSLMPFECQLFFLDIQLNNWSFAKLFRFFVRENLRENKKKHNPVLRIGRICQIGLLQWCGSWSCLLPGWRYQSWRGSNCQKETLHYDFGLFGTLSTFR